MPVLVMVKGGLCWSRCGRQGLGPGDGRGGGGIEQGPVFGGGDGRVIRDISWGSEGGKGSGELW